MVQTYENSLLHIAKIVTKNVSVTLHMASTLPICFLRLSHNLAFDCSCTGSKRKGGRWEGLGMRLAAFGF